MSTTTLAALTVAERITAVEDEVMRRWPQVTVEPKPNAGVLHIDSHNVSCVVTLAFTSFRSGNIIISEHGDKARTPHRLFVEGTATHVANEVAEALEQKLGPPQAAHEASVSPTVPNTH